MFSFVMLLFCWSFHPKNVKIYSPHFSSGGVLVLILHWLSKYHMHSALSLIVSTTYLNQNWKYHQTNIKIFFYMWRINEHQWSQQIITFADRKEVIMLNGGRNNVPGKNPAGGGRKSGYRQQALSSCDCLQQKE